MTSQLNVQAVQLGNSVTATQNFTVTVPNVQDGTMKIARGNAGATTQDILSVDSSGNISAITQALGDSSTKLATTAFVQANTATLTLGTAVSLTGSTGTTFGSIPSWVKRITIILNGVSTTANGIPCIRIGDAGGIQNTGYSSVLSHTTSSAISQASGVTTGFEILSVGNSAVIMTGEFRFINISGNIWIANGAIGFSSSSDYMTGGSKTLSGTLTQLQFTTTGGTDTFDAGSINILYEG